MRTLIAGLCLVAVGFVLEGCGGGGSTTCLNSQVDLVSQSLAGTVTGSATVNVNKISQHQEINAAMSEKMDFEKFNYASSISMPVTTKLPNGTTTMDMKVESKSVFRADQKTVTTWTKMTDNKKGTVTTNCAKKTMASMPTVEVLATYFKMIKKTMQEKATCGGNDGTDDTWKVDQKFDGPIPAIPGLPVKVPPGITADVTIGLTLKMDKDSLIHGGGVTMDVSGSATATGMTMHVIENSDLKISDSKAGGPSDADLDVSGWGDCKPLAGSEIDMLFQTEAPHEAAASAIASMSKGMVFQSHILATMQASLKPQHKSTVVV